jgi:hypothetical protein
VTGGPSTEASAISQRMNSPWFLSRQYKGTNMFLRRTQKEIAGGRRKAVYWFVAEK